MPDSGTIHFIETGTGSASSLTREAVYVISRCDQIYANAELMPLLATLAPAEAQKHAITAAERGSPEATERLRRAMIESAQRGESVVRVLTGEPFLFGNGVGDALAAAGEGLRPRALGGISREWAALRQAGIPLLHSSLARRALILSPPYPAITPEERAAVGGAQSYGPPTVEVPRPEPEAAATPEAEEQPKRPGIVKRRKKRERAASSSGVFSSSPRRQSVSLAPRTPEEEKERTLLPEFWSPDDTCQQAPFTPPATKADGSAKPQEAPAAAAVPAPAQAVEESAGLKWWKAAAQAGETIVFLEPLKFIGQIQAGLIAAGRPGSEPMAAIASPGTARQTTHHTTIASLTDDLKPLNLRPPLLLVAGDAVSLHQELRSFEEPPLRGLQVALLDDLETVLALEHHGAFVSPLFVGRYEPTAGLSQLITEMQDDLRTAACLLLHSAAAASAFFEGLLVAAMDLRVIGEHTRILVGDAQTEAIATRHFLRTTRLRGGLTAANVLEVLDLDLKGQRFVLVDHELEHRELVHEIRLRGGAATELPACQLAPDEKELRRLRADLVKGRMDVVLLGSPLALAALRAEWDDAALAPLLEDVWVVVRSTADQGVLKGLGINQVLCSRGDTDDLVRDLIAWRSAGSDTPNQML